MDNQNEESKTEDITKSVTIEINEDKFKEKSKEIQNEITNNFGYVYLITIKRSFLLKIKYFKFGKTIHFYLCCSLKEKQYKLSEIPTPPFTLGPECKLKRY
jgi:hypothetical protein